MAGRDPAQLRKGAEKVAQVLREAGHEAFFAGGCVRDLELGLEPKDYDVVTDARPERISSLFQKTVQVGASFGVVQVILRHIPYEVATYRKDGSYLDGRRPESVEYSDDKEEDVRRRDFTINALLMDPVSGEVLDFVGGRDDLKLGLVRAVGDPELRFAEDRLRMLRAARFASRLGFHLEEATAEAVRRHAPELGDVSAERIVGEVDAMLAGSRPRRALDLLDGLGLARPALHFLPESADDRRRLYDAVERAFAVGSGSGSGSGASEGTGEAGMVELDAEARLGLAWALLFGDGTPKQAEDAMRRLKLSRDRIRRVNELLQVRELLADPSSRRTAEVARWAAEARYAVVLRYAVGRGFEVAAQSLRRHHRDQIDHPLPRRPVVDGSDLKRFGIAPGPRFKEILKEVDDRVLERTIQTREEALEFVRSEYVQDPD